MRARTHYRLGSTSIKTVGGSSSGDQNITIGIVAPLSGELAPYGTDETSGYSAAAAWVNSLGGLLGKQVVLQVADSGSASPDGGTTEARDLVKTHKVAGILGFPLSNSIGPAMQQLQTPYLTFFQAGDVGEPRDYLFRPFPNLTPTPRVEALDMNNTMGFKRIGYVSATSTTLSTPAFFPYLKILNPDATWIPVPYPPQSDASSFDASSYIKAALAQNPPPDAFYVDTTSEVEAVQIILAINNQSFPSTAIYINAYVANIGSEFGDVTNLASIRCALADFSLVPPTAFNDVANRFSQFAGGATADADSGTAFDISGWLFLAIAKAGSTAGPDVEKALLELVGDPNGTQVTTGTLDVGLQLIAEGKPVWWVSGSVDPFILSAAGDDPVGPFDIMVGTEPTPETGNFYAPSAYNIPAFGK